MELPDDAPPLSDAPALADRMAGFACSLSKVTTLSTGLVKVELQVLNTDRSQAFRLSLAPKTVLFADFHLMDFGIETDEEWEEMLNGDDRE